MSTHSTPSRDGLPRKKISMYDLDDSSSDGANSRTDTGVLKKFNSASLSSDPDIWIEQGSTSRAQRSIKLNSSGEWKVMTDDDDEEEEFGNPVFAKTKSRHDSRFPERRTSGNDISPSLTKDERRSHKDMSAMAAMLADKHPWRRRRGSNGEEPVPSPPSKEKGHVSGSIRPVFKSLGEVEILSQKHSDNVIDSRRDDDSFSSGNFTSSGSSLGGLDSADACDEASESEEEHDVLEAFQNGIDTQHADVDSFPLCFLDPSTLSNPYLDPILLSSTASISRTDANRFALEHRIFLRALLQLLAERDHVGVEANVDDPENTIKRGPLKKFSRVTGRPNWKVKYVEVRRGSFSYFEDSAKTMETPGRKTIPLRANQYTCRPIDDPNVKGAYGYILELEAEDGLKRLWMANSEDERQAWMRAIRDATIGGDMQSSPQQMNMEQYRDVIERYEQIQIHLGDSRSEEEYLKHLSYVFGKSMRIPVQWTREQVGQQQKSNEFIHRNSELSATPMATLVKSNVTDLWKKLSQESVSINGHLMRSDKPHGTERIVGALSRCILEHDRGSPSETAMTELQAIIHARNVLSAYYKIRSKDEAYRAVDCMCRNTDLVVCLPHNQTVQLPLHIQVYRSAGVIHQGPHEKEKSGWIATRSCPPKRWKNRYCVVSEGVLSYYEHCDPRPHGLRGQLVLPGANVNQVVNQNNLFILRLVDGEDDERKRELCFRNKIDMVLWKEAIEAAIGSCTASDARQHRQTGSGASRSRASPRTPKMRKGMKGIGKGRIIKGASDKLRRMLPEKLPSFEETLSNTDLAVSTSESIKSEGTSTKEEPTVQVVVESSRYYKILGAGSTTSNDGRPLALIRANYMHSFFLSGGLGGRVAKGDELVEMECLAGNAEIDAFDTMFPRAIGC